MKFGLFYQIQVPKPWTTDSESRRLDEALEPIAYAEAMGSDSVWFLEHHFRAKERHATPVTTTRAAH